MQSPPLNYLEDLVYRRNHVGVKRLFCVSRKAILATNSFMFCKFSLIKALIDFNCFFIIILVLPPFVVVVILVMHF